ncbi:MAG: pyridoxamine 5'-phosphate oxidase [Symploca sp. SIO1B1]|nr:pyridoxamine 5'-phosphate oxidase [Symploca sp. SIO1B1]
MLPPWRSLLSSALHRNRSEPFSRYFQLATVTPEGYPSNRTVVFRGFLEDDRSSLKIITDIRSTKIQDIERQAIGEICWYFTKTREQFRIQGVLRLVKAQDEDADLLKARKITWHNLSDAARSQFAWADPGQPATGEGKKDAETRRHGDGENGNPTQNFVNPPAIDKSAFDVEPPDPNLPLDTFCLLLLVPQKVDHLQLRGDPQQRCIYQLQTDTAWSSQLVNP